jgi:putative addiction module component (TIGR02574 family)
MVKQTLEIDELTADERLRLIEDLWESLRQKPQSVPLAKAQREELDRRLDELENDGPSGIAWDEVVRQIKRRSKWSPLLSALMLLQTSKPPISGTNLKPQDLATNSWMESANSSTRLNHILNSFLSSIATHAALFSDGSPTNSFVGSKQTLLSSSPACMAEGIQGGGKCDHDG